MAALNAPGFGSRSALEILSDEGAGAAVSAVWNTLLSFAEGRFAWSSLIAFAVRALLTVAIMVAVLTPIARRTHAQ